MCVCVFFLMFLGPQTERDWCGLKKVGFEKTGKAGYFHFSVEQVRIIRVLPTATWKPETHHTVCTCLLALFFLSLNYCCSHSFNSFLWKKFRFHHLCCWIKNNSGYIVWQNASHLGITSGNRSFAFTLCVRLITSSCPCD